MAKVRIGVTLAAALLLPVAARAATIVEQALPDAWLASPTGYCSPCSLQPGSRMFASFELLAAVDLGTARIAAISSPFGFLGDFSVSIWTSPLATEGPLFETLVREGDYQALAGSSGYIDVTLPEWRLGAGTYWLSILGVNGDAFQWGGVLNAGDDRRFNNGVVTLISGTDLPRSYLLGFRLEGNDPVVAPIGGTLPLLSAGLASLAFLRRKRKR